MRIQSKNEMNLLKDYTLPKRHSTPFPLSKKSKNRLDGVDVQLVRLVHEMLYYMNISVIEGLRSVDTQKYYVSIGVSKTMNSKHLSGKAVDLYPYPVPRKEEGEIDSDSPAWDEMGKLALTLARALGIQIQWGGLWVSLIDKPHFEIKEN